MDQNASVSVKEIAFLIGRHEESVRRAIRSGKLKARSLGHGPKAGYRVDVSELTRWRGGESFERRSFPATFREDGELLPNVPELKTPPLPPVMASDSELLEYARRCQQLAAIALKTIQRRIDEGVKR